MFLFLWLSPDWYRNKGDPWGQRRCWPPLQQAPAAHDHFAILQRCTHIPSFSNIRHPHIHMNGHNFSTSMGWKDAESGLGPLFQAWRSSKDDRDRMIQNKHWRAVPAAELTRPHGVGPHQTLGVSQHVWGTQPWILVTVNQGGRAVLC